MSLLDSAGATVASPAIAYEIERGPTTDPDNAAVTYAVERRVSDGSLHLHVSRERKDKDPSERRIPLAPVGRALALGLLD